MMRQQQPNEILGMGSHRHMNDVNTKDQAIIEQKKVGDLLVATVGSNGGPPSTKRNALDLLNRLGKNSPGRVLCLYSDGGPGKDLVTEWCVPVTGDVDSNRFSTKILKGCTMLSYLHRGPRKALGQAWEFMFDHIEGNNIPVAGPRREIYHSPEKPNQPTATIELQVPLAATSGQANHRETPIG
jgi:effector-binding domain-containing protein